MDSRKADEFDYNLIKTMNEVIRSGNLSRAAANLNLSVSAVSASLKKLRHHFGGDLFYRTVNGLKPTSAAMEIHSSFSKAMNIIESVVKNPERRQSTCSFLKIICPDIFEHHFITDRSSNIEFSNHHFGQEADMIQSFLHNNVDILIGNYILHHERIISRKLKALEDFVIVCSKNNLLSGQASVTLSHYYASPHACYSHYLLGPLKTPFGGLVSVDTPYPGEIRTAYTSSSISGVLNMLESGDMLAVFPRNIAHYFIHDRDYNLAEFHLPAEIQIISPPLYINYLADEVRDLRINQIVSNFI
ncbi:LysR family transcriptional regulator [Rahnella sp. BCC 1045]|uniref:LysR family transcriptional regulator n=1 Tax=Rahnella sp. BCC 1045 TaxID=2816251 RepID=UPI001C274AE4|nr:LysR family transcriptional regulator [Rahnella sp. BCC 1045]MBU9818415.1 LysR family transcriptional regulator [Rahnella sp. BCC 1045]